VVKKKPGGQASSKKNDSLHSGLGSEGKAKTEDCKNENPGTSESQETSPLWIVRILVIYATEKQANPMFILDGHQTRKKTSHKKEEGE